MNDSVIWDTIDGKGCKSHDPQVQAPTSRENGIVERKKDRELRQLWTNHKCKK